MSWQWMVFLIGSYVGGAYILRSMAKSVALKKRQSYDYSTLACAFLVSPLWVWFWTASVGSGKVIQGIGRWISGN